MKRPSARLRSRFILIVFLLLLVSGINPAREASTAGPREDTAHLDFVRTETTHLYRGRPLNCENYLVKEGDYIWKILRSRGHHSTDQLVHFTEALRALNPEVEDLDLIQPGQRLLVPLGYLKEKSGKAPAGEKRATTIHKVRPGETLAGILRNRCGLPDHLVFNEGIQRLKELNPEVKDPNRIRVGQRLVIPVLAGVEDKDKEVVIDARRGRPAGAPVREAGAGGILKTRLAPALEPEEERLQVLADAVMAVVVAMGGQCRNRGQHFLPLAEEGQISLRASQFPLLEFPTGERIFLDINDRLSLRLEEAIRDAWQGRYCVVDLNEGDNFHSVWQRLMERFTRMEPWSSREPLLLQEPLQMAVRGDWVLTVDPGRPGLRAIVINLLYDGSERTDRALQAFLDGMGVRVVDLRLRGQKEPARVLAPLDDRAFAPRSASPRSAPESAPEAVAAFLDLLDQPYLKDASLPIYQKGSKGIGVTVKAGLSFWKKGKLHLIDFKLLSRPLLQLLEERDIDFLVVEPGWSVERVFEAMTDHLDMQVEDTFRFQVSSRKPGRNISVALPGYLVKEKEERYLITPKKVPPSLEDYLRREGVAYLSYAGADQ